MNMRVIPNPFGQPAPIEGDAAFPGWRRSVGLIAFGAGVASFSMNFWVPFLPIYMRDLGAGSEARALFWVAVGMSANGIFRIIAGPFWGTLADRYGRKPMFVRALFGATVTTLIAVVAREPWHVAVAWACQGFFSGFIPAAVALTSVSVPRGRLTSALGTVQAAQYMGTTIGPALGALLAATAGLRGAILAAALMPAVAAVVVLLRVPRDQTAPTSPAGAAHGRARWAARMTEGMGRQFLFGLLLYFWVFMTGQLVRLVAPVAIGRIQGHDAATGATGIAFFVAGLASVAGAVVLARWVSRPGHLRSSLTVMLVISAAASTLLGIAWSVAVFTLLFSIISLAQGAMLPASNSVIAMNVPPERRGAAFGIASSVQALSFVVGPTSAAVFAATSFGVGFGLVGLGLAATALATYLVLREPDAEGAATPRVAASPTAPTPGPSPAWRERGA